MELSDFLQLLPDYAYDMKANLQNLLSENGALGLSPKEVAAVAVATSMNTNSVNLIATIENWSSVYLNSKELDGAKTAHAIMSMTNVYYRFLHVVDNVEYKRMPPNLAMHAEANPGIDKRSFELAALAVSAMNNCKACVDFHELSLRRLGVSATGIQSAVRLAAVMQAVGELTKFED